MVYHLAGYWAVNLVPEKAAKMVPPMACLKEVKMGSRLVANLAVKCD